MTARRPGAGEGLLINRLKCGGWISSATTQPAPPRARLRLTERVTPGSGCVCGVSVLSLRNTNSALGRGTRRCPRGTAPQGSVHGLQSGAESGSWALPRGREGAGSGTGTGTGNGNENGNGNGAAPPPLTAARAPPPACSREKLFPPPPRGAVPAVPPSLRGPAPQPRPGHIRAPRSLWSWRRARPCSGGTARAPRPR